MRIIECFWVYCGVPILIVDINWDSLCAECQEAHTLRPPACRYGASQGPGTTGRGHASRVA